MPEQIKAQSAMALEQFKATQEQQKVQAEQQIEQMKMQMQVEMDRNREEMQARQKMLESEQKAQLEAQKAQIAAQADIARLEFERWKAELDAAVKLQIAEMSKPEPADEGVDDTIAEVIANMKALQDEMAAPAELVRGPDGKAAGVKRGDRMRKVVRGPDGRAIGLQ